MSVTLQPVSNKIQRVVNDWQRTIDQLKEADASISVALARIERADRLRKFPSTLKQAVELAIASGLEFTGQKHMCTLPFLILSLRAKLADIQNIIEQGGVN